MRRHRRGILGSWGMLAFAVCLLAFELNMLWETHLLVDRITH